MCGAVRHFSSTLYSSEGKVCPVSCMYFFAALQCNIENLHSELCEFEE